MARTIINEILENIEEIADTSDDEKFLLPVPAYLDAMHDADNEMLQLIQLGLRGIQRTHYIKVNNYIESVVRNYINKDFIMHFHLSRSVAYNLIERICNFYIFARTCRICANFSRKTYFNMFMVSWFLVRVQDIMMSLNGLELQLVEERRPLWTIGGVMEFAISRIL